MTRLKRRKELPSDNRGDVRFGTPQEAAEYRATRIAALSPDTIIEIGAGAGFQTTGFSRIAKKVIAVDIDADRLARATFPENVIPIAGDALDAGTLERIKREAKGKIVIFLDPERPASSTRRTLSEIQPDVVSFVREYSSIAPDIAIELPPFLSDGEFSALPPHEREYLSIDGKLNRLTVYFGALRRCDISVVRLPDGARIEGNFPLTNMEQTARDGMKFVLVPDAAVAHAGLIGEALAIGGVRAVHSMPLGNKTVYLSATRCKGPFFKSMRIMAAGPRREVERSLFRCGPLVLHGKLSEQEQRELLISLRKFCKGNERMHLFLGSRWYLTEG